MMVAAETQDAPVTIPRQEKANILLVDDRPDKLLALESVLASLNENIVKVNSGKEALRQLLHKDFAVILLDVNMPGMDGFETAQIIRQRKNTEKTPIIFFTALSDTDTHVSRGYSLGAVDYLRTPVEPDILKAKVAAFVELHKQADQVRRQAAEMRERQEQQHQTELAEAADRLEVETKRNRFFTLAVDMLAIAGFDGYFKQLNPSWQKSFGYSEEELKARRFIEFVHTEDRDATAARLRDLTAGGQTVYFENRFLCRDGCNFRWVGWTAAPFAAEGLLYVFARDITDLKQAEEERVQLVMEQAARAAAEASERRAAFLANASNALAASLEYRTTLARVARLAVPTIADWCFVDILEEDGAMRRVAVSHADPAKAALAEAAKRHAGPAMWQGPQGDVLRTGKAILIEDVDHAIARIVQNEEHARVIHEIAARSAMVAPLVSRGRTLGTLTLISAESGRRFAMSDLALAEELSRRAAIAVENAWLYKESQDARRAAETANRAKDEFLATLSHELRTPLSPILGWTVMLRSGSLDPATAARALEVIERNVRAQTQLIEDLLDVSRIITGKMRIEVRPMDFGAVVEAGMDAVRPSAEAKNIKLELVRDPSVGPMVGDPDRLQQVVWNLVSNAVKFTPAGGRVTIEVAPTGSQVRIRVKDTGKGISPEFLPYVFDRFRQADSSSTRTHGGLGLGLAIVRHLVELHGGTVQAESAGEDQGATFIVRLPTRPTSPRPHVDRVADVEAATAPAGTRLDGLKVLVVDDEEDMREFLGLALRRAGAEVIACGSTREALSLLDQSVPDVLVSDIGMPDENGFGLIRRVRAREPERGGRVPAAALTAYASGEDGARALASGFQVHVSKPVQPEELVSAVATLAGKQPPPLA
jgi:PAS domain S-box-containing protein